MDGNGEPARRPRLSIVVPFYGVERYIAECLESLRAQSFADFEAILVDDGSPDGSLAIAQQHAASDDRFRIVRQHNQGLGTARNTGARYAVGEYLTFVDSDDVVPPHAYRRMIASLDRTGSDMAAGNARRFNDLGVRDSWVHQVPFARPRPRTHVREFPSLALDRMAWNKMYRRSFWDREGFAYPVGLYEDYPVTIASHLFADRVDVLATPVYYWRERDGGDLSITQRVWEMDNLRERVASAERVLDLVADESTQLRGEVGRHFLHIDVGAVLAALHRAPADLVESEDERRREILELARRLVSRIDADQVALSSPFDRVQAHLVLEGDLDGLSELTHYRARHGRNGSLQVREQGSITEFFRDLPGLDAGVPEEIYRVAPARVRLQGTLQDTRWVREPGGGDALIIDVRVAVDQLDLTGAQVFLHLVSPSGRSRSVPSHILTQGPRRELRLTLRPALLAELDDPGHWRLEVEARVAGLHRRGRVTGLTGTRTRWSEQRLIGPHLWAKPARDQGAFGVLIRRPEAALTEVAAAAAELSLSGWFVPPTTREDTPPMPVLWLTLNNGADVVPATVDLAPPRAGDPVGSARFEALLDAEMIASHGLEDHITERSVWNVRMAVGTEPPVSLCHPSVVGSAVAVVGHRRVSILPGPTGLASVHEEYAHPSVDRARAEDGAVELSGWFDRSGDRPSRARWRGYITPDNRVDVEVPVSWCAEERRFAVRAPVAELVDRAAAARAEAADVVEGDAATSWALWLLTEEASPPPPRCPGVSAEPAMLSVADVHRMPTALQAGGHAVTLHLGRMGRLSVVVDGA